MLGVLDLTGVPDLLLEPSSDLLDGEAGTGGRGVLLRGKWRGLDSLERGALYFLLEPSSRLVVVAPLPGAVLEGMLGVLMLDLAEAVPEDWDREWATDDAVEMEVEDKVRLGVVSEGLAMRDA